MTMDNCTNLAAIHKSLWNQCVVRTLTKKPRFSTMSPLNHLTVGLSWYLVEGACKTSLEFHVGAPSPAPPPGIVQ